MIIKKNIAILISGTGSNMEAIIKDCKTKNHPGQVKLVISNNKKALGISKAEKHGVKTLFISIDNKNKLNDFEQKLLAIFIAEKINLVCLAGFMKILSDKFIKNFQGEIINIHPSILPSLKGLNTHKRIIDKKIKNHGATVHLVTENIDSGIILGQVTIKIFKGDTPSSLAKRLIPKEHELYKKVIRNLLSNNRKVLQIT